MHYSGCLIRNLSTKYPLNLILTIKNYLSNLLNPTLKVINE